MPQRNDANPDGSWTAIPRPRSEGLQPVTRDPMTVTILEFVDFRPSLISLRKRGGKYQKAADDAYATLARMGDSGKAAPDLPTTNHGESRIRHCVKYDLTGYCRLITYQNDRTCIFLYCGDHSQCDEWLDAHAGWTPVVGSAKGIQQTRVNTAVSAGQLAARPSGLTPGPLYEQLPEHLLERLIADVPRAVVRAVERWTTAVLPSEIWTTLLPVADPAQRSAIGDVFTLLRLDRAPEALERVRLFLGEVVLLEDLPTEELPDIVDNEVIARIDPKSRLYQEGLKRFMDAARYRDWMLFMHPHQRAVADADFDGPAMLTGVSGSGKTCVVVQRAVRLAGRYPGGKVLVLTLNPALAVLIRQLVDTVSSPEERSRIDVKSFFTFCQDLIHTFEPENARLYNEYTWKHQEHVDDIWQEFYRCENNNRDAAVLQPVHDTLLTRGWNPERYIREEMDWLRSALRRPERSAYHGMERKGRTVSLTSSFRKLVADGLAGWEQKMLDIGVVDSLGIAQALCRHLDWLEPTYRAILVDEAQDFGNVELQIITRLATPGANSLFLCGDAAQAVTTKYQLLRAVGLEIPRTNQRRLTLNYRNSKDILAAASAVLLGNMTDDMIDREDFPMLDPEYSAFSASTPLLLEADSLASEFSRAMAYAQELTSRKREGKACIAFCGYSFYELASFGRALGLPVLDGLTDIEGGSIFLSDLEQSKGFEFDLVCVLNCRAGVLPHGAAPEEERFRDLAKLYVAMTRAKTDLVLSWSGELSPFLANAGGHLLSANWAEYGDDRSVPHLGEPQRLESLRPYGIHRSNWRKLSASDFLYSSDFALGLSPELIAKLRELVDGRGLRRGTEAVKWTHLGSAADAFRSRPRARALWGPEVGAQFLLLVERLERDHGRGS